VKKTIVLRVSGKSPNTGRLVSSTNTQEPQVTLVPSAGYRRSKQMSCLKRLSKGSSHSPLNALSQKFWTEPFKNLNLHYFLSLAPS